jgi:adenylylsulfate kinase
MAWVAWLTGLPGSGKSSVGREVARRLEERGIRVRVLELDEIRRVVTPSPSYTAEEREVLYLALAYMAWLLYNEGVSVIIDATAHRRRFRDVARALIPAFAEIFLRASLPACLARAGCRHGSHAPADVYGQAGRKGSTVPGVDEMYEPPLHPELVLDTEELQVTQAADRVVRFLEAFQVGLATASLDRDREDRLTAEEALMNVLSDRQAPDSLGKQDERSEACPYLRRTTFHCWYRIEGYCLAHPYGGLQVVTVAEFRDLCTTAEHIRCQPYRRRHEQDLVQGDP